MNEKNHYHKHSYLYLGVDLLAIIFLWYLAYFFRFYTMIPTPLGIPSLFQYTKLLPFIAAIWIVSASFTGSYDSKNYVLSRRLFLFGLMKLCGLFTLALVSFVYFYDEFDYSRLTTLIFASLLPFVIYFARRFARKVFRRFKLFTPSKETMLITAGHSLREFFSRHDLHSELRITKILLANEDSYPEDSKLCLAKGLTVIEKHEDWATTFEKYPCESVVVSLPYADYKFLEDHLDGISDQVTDVRIVPDVVRYTKFHAGITMLNDTPVIHIHESPLRGPNAALKRLMDIVGSLVALTLFAPLMLILAILIPLSSRGPILYRQQRMGLDGKTFYCLKFRSMPTDAEEKTGAIWATADDNRATRLGSILRKTSMDELPQLFNVLKGEMSLVGPRPERPVFVQDFRKKVPGYMLRHKVKTGITGWAQVNGWRGSTSIQKRIECDLYYIQNWSLWLDIKILVMTLEEVFLGKNAY